VGKSKTLEITIIKPHHRFVCIICIRIYYYIILLNVMLYVQNINNAIYMRENRVRGSRGWVVRAVDGVAGLL